MLIAPTNKRNKLTYGIDAPSGSGRRKGSNLENPKDRIFKGYTSPTPTPYTSPYGPRAVSVFELDDEKTSGEAPTATRVY